MYADATDRLMTVGQLSRRTGLSIKAIRQYEALRSLGLTIKEIDQLARAYLSRPDESIGPRLAALLDASERRIEDRTAELAACRDRIHEYCSRHAAALARGTDGDLFGLDPRQPAA